MAKHTPSIPSPQHPPADDYGGIDAGASLAICVSGTLQPIPILHDKATDENAEMQAD
jgi:hypothetical protein